MINLAVTYPGGYLVTAIDPSEREWGRLDVLDNLLIVALAADLNAVKQLCGPLSRLEVDAYGDPVRVIDGPYSHRLDLSGIDVDGIRASEDWLIPTVTMDRITEVERA